MGEKTYVYDVRVVISRHGGLIARYTCATRAEAEGAARRACQAGVAAKNEPLYVEVIQRRVS